MGFSTTAAFTIIFITSLVVVGMVYSTFYEQLRDYVYQLKLEKEEINEKANTKLEILSLTAVGTNTTHDLTITVKNAGTVTLKVSKFDLLIDGVLVNFTYDRDYLYPETNVTIQANNLDGGTGTTHRLKLVANNGYAIYYTYVVS